MDGVLQFGGLVLGGAYHGDGVVTLLVQRDVAGAGDAAGLAVVGGGVDLHRFCLKGHIGHIVVDGAAEGGTEGRTLNAQRRQSGIGGGLVVGVLLAGDLDDIGLGGAVGRRDLQGDGIDAYGQVIAADVDGLALVVAVIIQTQLGHAVRDLGGVVRGAGGEGGGQGGVAAHDGGQGAVTAGRGGHAARPAGGAHVDVGFAVGGHDIAEAGAEGRAALNAGGHLQRHGDDAAAGAVGAIDAEMVLVHKNAPAADGAGVVGEGQAVAAVQVRRQAEDLTVHGQGQRHGIAGLNAAAAGEGRAGGLRPLGQDGQHQQARCDQGKGGAKQFVFHVFHGVPPAQMVRWPTVTWAAWTTSVMVTRPSPLMSAAFKAASFRSPAPAA